MVYIDENDNIKFHASSFILNGNQRLFTSELQERFLEVAGLKTSLDDSLGPSQDWRSLEIGDTEEIVTFYETALRALQQLNCRSIAKVMIKAIEPRKQVKHPYNGERIRLLVHLFREIGRRHNITANKLQKVEEDAKRVIEPVERIAILNEIFKVRKLKKRYEMGEIDRSTVIRVINRNGGNGKQNHDSESSEADQVSDQVKSQTSPTIVSRRAPLNTPVQTNPEDWNSALELPQPFSSFVIPDQQPSMSYLSHAAFVHAPLHHLAPVSSQINNNPWSNAFNYAESNVRDENFKKGESIEYLYRYKELSTMAGNEKKDSGISVGDIAKDRAKLEEKAKIECEEDVVLDPEWTDVKKFESSPSVRAVLLRKQNPAGGVARVEGYPSRYTLTDRVTDTVLIAAKPGETIVLLGYPSVRCFRRRS
ncbi:hypothetical protein FQN54_003810 [Arachnomyces sp. PD_36]|nr:hypothetical protein FQN54_003810 [Arachnomyces sp. PD_36]